METQKVLCAVAVAMALGLAGSAFAASDTATQTVTITVEEIAQLGVSGDPGTLTLANATTTPGSLPTAATDATTSLSWTSNVAATTRKITAAIDSDYTAGVVLKATLAEPAGTNGTTGGQQTLGTTATDMLTGITNENCTGATITFEASLSAMVAPIASESRTLTWTLTAEQ
jgi:hypothetical protein